MSTAKSPRSLIELITPSFLRPRLCGSPGEVGVADRRHSGDVLDVVVGPGAMAGGDGLGQHAEHLAVRGGQAGRDAAVDPCIAVDVVVLYRLAGDAADDARGGAYGVLRGGSRCVHRAGAVAGPPHSAG